MSKKKLRILLLSVNAEVFFYDQLVIPFGLVSIASYLEKDDYEIKGIDMNTPSRKIPLRYLKVDEKLLKEIIDFSPDVLAMSTYATNIYNVLFWAKVLKKRLLNCLILIGGNHASYIASECLEKCPELDVIVRFEGEIPFKMICEQVKKSNFDFSNIPNITYRINGKIKENPQIELIKNIDVLPILNRDFFKNKNKTNDDIFHADMISARGCPFNCTFCNCNHYWNKMYRLRSIDDVIKELKELKKKYPYLKSIRFRDESITINKMRCKKLCDAIIKSELNFDFQAHSRLDGLNEDVIKTLSLAGFKQLFIGLESGSKRVLKRLQKGIDITRAEKVVSLLKKYGLNYRFSFIFLTPQERFKDIWETIKLIRKLKLSKNEYSFNVGIVIYPGTAECKKFLNDNHNYEWITKNYKFSGKYVYSRDSRGNIMIPVYREFGMIKTSLFEIYRSICLRPFDLLNYFKRIPKTIYYKLRFI